MNHLLISNVAYGPIYTTIFLEHHLKSFLDESNIPAVADRIEYLVFSDAETLPMIKNHPNFQKLENTVPVEIIELKWPEQEFNKFNVRYDVLVTTFKVAVQKAIDKKMVLSALVADLVAARDYLPRVLAKMDEGYDAVFMQPPRCAAEVVMPELGKYPRAMHSDDLWRLCYENMHPLWVACHIDAAQFTKLPFSLLWNSGLGLLCRSFSITPIVFTPYPEMLQSRGMVDGDVPALCKNPYWTQDWDEAPILGVEPLFCYYPPFANHRASAKWILEWSKCLHESQFKNPRKHLYYPNKEASGITQITLDSSNKLINEILNGAQKV